MTMRRIVIEVPFYAVKRTVFRPVTFIAFRAINLTLGRLPRVAYWIKSLLVKVLIYRRRPIPLMLRRTIVLKDEGIEVRDHLRASRPIRIDVLRRVAVFSTVHMGSSRYFQPNELHLPPRDCSGQGDTVPVERLGEGVELRREIRATGR